MSSSTKRNKSDSAIELPTFPRKPRVEIDEGGPFVVWLYFDGDYAKFCTANTHREAHMKVEALTMEKDAYVRAGGSLRGAENRTYYFYVNSRMEVLSSELLANGSVKIERAKYSGVYGEKHYRSDDKKVGKLVKGPIDHDSNEWWGKLDSSSMRFAAQEDGLHILVPFMRNIKAMSPEYLAELKNIYTCGDYDSWPSDAELAELEKELKEELEQKEEGEASQQT